MSTLVQLIVLFGAVVAGAYAVMTAIHLLRVARQPPRSRPGPSPVPADDVPMYRFKGEAFEATWQGIRGYQRPDPPNINENWTTRLIPAVFAPLRPSRFSDPSYWNRYLPGVAALWLVIFVGFPLLIGFVVQPAPGSVATFAPTLAQRTVPTHGVSVSEPAECSDKKVADASSIPSVAITYNDDGTVFYVRAGGPVSVTYPYGRPGFSPSSPLCADSARDSLGHAYYVAADSGSGFVYIPEPTGTIVAEIDVTPSRAFLSYSLCSPWRFSPSTLS